jgi:hypothetical protein
MPKAGIVNKKYDNIPLESFKAMRNKVASPQSIGNPRKASNILMSFKSVRTIEAQAGHFDVARKYRAR